MNSAELLINLEEAAEIGGGVIGETLDIWYLDRVMGAIRDGQPVVKEPS